MKKEINADDEEFEECIKELTEKVINYQIDLVEDFFEKTFDQSNMMLSISITSVIRCFHATCKTFNLSKDEIEISIDHILKKLDIGFNKIKSDIK